MVAASFVPGLAWLVYFLWSRRAIRLRLGFLFFLVGIVSGPLALGAFQIFELSPFYAELSFPDLADDTQRFVYALFAIGPVEELAKFGAMLILIRAMKIEITNLTSVLAATTAVAIGFATVENWYYMLDVEEVAWHRALTLPFNHVLFSSFWGVGLYRDATEASGRAWIVLTLLLASVYHGLYDYILLSDSIHPAFVLPVIALLYFWLASVFKAQKRVSEQSTQLGAVGTL
jgi:RsiW-degrading membrane proteinase PrsW (M82 family)